MSQLIADGSTPGNLRYSVFRDAEGAAGAAAAEIAELIRRRAAEGRRAVLGLATGATPVSVYDELLRLHRSAGLSFRNVVTFNLDEYWPMPAERLQSYQRFMQEHLFAHVDVDPRNIHIPDGSCAAESVEEHCRRYEQAIREAGGIDIQLLGIGRSGHIGFNEPGSSPASRTRLITLDKVTRLDAAGDFFGERNVPRRALTMGVGTILEARRALLLAFGEGKAAVIQSALEGPVSDQLPASFLQQHPHATALLDEAAACELRPVKTPWLCGPLAARGLSWDAALTRRAVIWLAQKLGKPILKLVNEDYNEHGLQELLSLRGAAYDLNLEVFRYLRDCITGWPGGKANRPRRDGSADPFPKRVVVFSPHPDDDVISMGGTLIRLCEQGHEVHVAYQTSGNIAVFDEKALRHCNFVAEFARAFRLLDENAITRIEEAVERFLSKKLPGDVDSPELQLVKGLIRRSEARAAARYCGVAEERIHFLDLPFYETGRVRKRALGADDIRVVAELLDRVRPNQVYAAGDLSDPHGTHRVCLRAVTTALHEARATWRADCELWLYRGAWQEWEPHRVERVVPLSPDEVDRKRHAIFFHESQKDRALFPGPSDSREFWQRAEERNRRTADIFDQLGLPEYQALEAFVRWNPQP